MAIVGYARVSTGGQSVESQVAELKGAGATKVFHETVSGAVTDRAALKRALGSIQAGDVLLVTRLDRLARSTRDLLNILDEIGKCGGGFRSLRDVWADTTTPHGRLMLTVLGGLAEFERELILVRTGEGRQRAKDRGVRLGRRPKLTPHQRQEALARRERGESVTDIARSYAVHHTTIGRLARLGTQVRTPTLADAKTPGNERREVGRVARAASGSASRPGDTAESRRSLTESSRLPSVA